MGSLRKVPSFVLMWEKLLLGRLFYSNGLCNIEGKSFRCTRENSFLHFTRRSIFEDFLQC